MPTWKDYEPPVVSDIPDYTTRDGLEWTNDHCTRGMSRLIEQYKDKPRIEAIVCTINDQVQDLETALWRLYTERGIDYAYGIQLDKLGEIVGEERKGQTDEPYRRFIRVRILVNKSDGKFEQLLEIALLALNDAEVPAEVKVTEYFPAAVDVTINSAILTFGLVPFYLFALLRLAKAAGVNLTMQFVWGEIAEAFTFGSSSLYPEDGTDLGWGSTSDATLGGEWSSGYSTL